MSDEIWRSLEWYRDELTRLRAQQTVAVEALQQCFDATHELADPGMRVFVKKTAGVALATLDVPEEL